MRDARHKSGSLLQSKNHFTLPMRISSINKFRKNLHILSQNHSR